MDEAVFLLLFAVLSGIFLPIMVIRMRHTRAHTKNRRSHHALKTPTLAVCSHCQAHHRPHHMCLSCGYYNGRQVIDLEAKAKAREERIANKKARIKEQSDQVAPTEAEAVTEAEPEKAPDQKEEKQT